MILNTAIFNILWQTPADMEVDGPKKDGQEGSATAEGGNEALFVSAKAAYVIINVDRMFQSLVRRLPTLEMHKVPMRLFLF